MKLLRALTATRSQISLKLREECKIYTQPNEVPSPTSGLALVPGSSQYTSSDTEHRRQ